MGAGRAAGKRGAECYSFPLSRSGAGEAGAAGGEKGSPQEAWGGARLRIT
jgi:hypothetical protein